MDALPIRLDLKVGGPCISHAFQRVWLGLLLRREPPQGHRLKRLAQCLCGVRSRPPRGALDAGFPGYVYRGSAESLSVPKVRRFEPVLSVLGRSPTSASLKQDLEAWLAEALSQGGGDRKSTRLNSSH